MGYIAIVIVVLAIIALLVFFSGKNKLNKLTPLASLAFGFVLAGILFADNRIMGYGLMGAGVLLAILDIVNREKRNREK